MTAPRTPVELIIDRCIEDLRAGRVTVEECLLRFPQDREVLEPALRAAAAMSQLPRLEQARTPDPARRAAFMAALRDTPQQRRRRIRVPSLATLLSAGAFRVVGPAFALAAVAVAVVLGGGGTPATASTLTVFVGEVQRLDGVEWRTLRDGSALEAGVRMRTAAGSHAVITFPDGSTVALDPQTEVLIETLAMSPRRIEVRQQSGRLWHDIVHDETDGSRFVVLTPDARIEVLGTVFETSVDAVTGKTDVATVEGEVRVVAGEQAVPVGRGETLRARKETIEDVATAPLLDSALTISGPFASAMLTPDGRGTGVRIDGVVFRQLRGITTALSPGVQRFDLQSVDPGEYVLFVQRYGDGAGEIVIDMPEGQQRFVIEAGVALARLPLRIDVAGGIPLLVATSLEITGAAPAPVVRVAESERTKAAIDLVVQAREKRREQDRDDERDTVRAAVTRTATKTPAARATTATPERKAPTPRATERTATATSTPIATRAATTRTASPTPTPQTRSTVTAQADAEVNAAYTRRLRAAVTSGDLEAIRQALEEAVGGESLTLRRARVSAIVTALENQTSAQRIALLFVDGKNGRLRDDLREALSAHSDSGRARLDAAIVIAEARRLEQLSKQKIPTPTPTPAKTVVPVNQATTTPSPTATPTQSAPSTSTPTPTPSTTPARLPAVVPSLLPAN